MGLTIYTLNSRTSQSYLEQAQLLRLFSWCTEQCISQQNMLFDGLNQYIFFLCFNCISISIASRRKDSSFFNELIRTADTCTWQNIQTIQIDIQRKVRLHIILQPSSSLPRNKHCYRSPLSRNITGFMNGRVFTCKKAQHTHLQLSFPI